MHGRRGMHGGGHAWQGVYMAEGIRGRGCAWQGMHGRGDMHVGETATEVGGNASYWNAFLLLNMTDTMGEGIAILKNSLFQFLSCH